MRYDKPEVNAAYYKAHAEERKQYQKAYRLAHIEHIRIKDKWKAIKRNYGINPEQYDRLFQSQLGKCAICGKHQSEIKRALSVDHCHKTGCIRGLVCNFCNYGLGFLDREEFMSKANLYLSR